MLTHALAVDRAARALADFEETPPQVATRLVEGGR